MFGRFLRKWHSVKWRSGHRRVNLSIHFDTSARRNGARRNGEMHPTIEKLPGAIRAPVAAPAVEAPDEQRIVAEVLEAVKEFNLRNRTLLSVAAIRYQADDTTGHLEAARKLLNQL